MTLDELKQRLHDAGCSTANYHIGEPQGASDVYCLAKRNGRFHYFYTERGLDQEPEKIFDDEAEACQFFYEFVMNIRHNHLVGYYESPDNLERHATFLEERGIGFQSLQESIDTTTSGGRLIFHIFGALADVYDNLKVQR